MFPETDCLQRSVSFHKFPVIFVCDLHLSFDVSVMTSFMLPADMFNIETVEKLLAGVVSRDVAFNLTFQAVQQYGKVRTLRFKHEADNCLFKGLCVFILFVKVMNELLLLKREAVTGCYFRICLVEFPVAGYH